MRECGILEDYSSIRQALVDHLDYLDHIPSSLFSSLPPFVLLLLLSLPNVVFRFLYSPAACFAFAFIHESRVQSALQLRCHDVDDAPPRSKPNRLLVPLPAATTAAAAEFYFRWRPPTLICSSLTAKPTPLSLPPARNNKSKSPHSFLLHFLLHL